MKLETLHKYHEEGWLIKQSHPTLPLTIWNYSPATQYEGKWDEVTLRCRGLITEDITERILIQPFNKFFNYEELIGKEQIPYKRRLCLCSRENGRLAWHPILLQRLGDGDSWFVYFRARQ